MADQKDRGSLLFAPPRTYTIPAFVDLGILQPFPANEPLPTPIPRDVLSARLRELDTYLPYSARPSLRPPADAPYGVPTGAYSWARRFDSNLHIIWPYGYRQWNMDNKHEKFMWMGLTEGEEKNRQGPNSRMVWEVIRLIGNDPTCVGCILADTSHTAQLTSEQILQSEQVCLLRLLQRHIKERPGLARMTATVITLTHDSFRVVQAVLPENTRMGKAAPYPLGMRVTWRQELSALIGDSPEAMENWMTAVSWLLFNWTSESPPWEGSGALNPRRSLPESAWLDHEYELRLSRTPRQTQSSQKA